MVQCTIRVDRGGWRDRMVGADRHVGERGEFRTYDIPDRSTRSCDRIEREDSVEPVTHADPLADLSVGTHSPRLLFIASRGLRPVSRDIQGRSEHSRNDDGLSGRDRRIADFAVCRALLCAGGSELSFSARRHAVAGTGRSGTEMAERFSRGRRVGGRRCRHIHRQTSLCADRRSFILRHRSGDLRCAGAASVVLPGDARLHRH